MRRERAGQRFGRPRGVAAGAVVASLAALATPVRAHHSISAVYDSAQRREIEAVVVEFQFVNPHPLVIVTVTADDGAAQPWRLELDNRFELAQIGITGDTLRPGDRVVATGSLGRRDPTSLYVRRLDRPADGLRYEQIGGRPRLSRIP